MSILDRGANASAVLAALSKSQAIIEFDLSGKILTGNEYRGTARRHVFGTLRLS
mgnify:CR=1 FL=1